MFKKLFKWLVVIVGFIFFITNLSQVHNPV